MSYIWLRKTLARRLHVRGQLLKCQANHVNVSGSDSWKDLSTAACDQLVIHPTSFTKGSDRGGLNGFPSPPLTDRLNLDRMGDEIPVIEPLYNPNDYIFEVDREDGGACTCGQWMFYSSAVRSALSKFSRWSVVFRWLGADIIQDIARGRLNRFLLRAPMLGGIMLPQFIHTAGLANNGENQSFSLVMGNARREFSNCWMCNNTLSKENIS